MTNQLTGQYDERYRIVRPDGEERWIHDRAFPICDDSGQVVRIAGIARDITARKREEQRVAALVRELAAMKKALDEHAIVAITDQAGTIQYVNDLFCKISGYSREELLGRDHRIINSGYHSKEFIRGLWTTIASGRVWKGEMKNLAKEGSIYWVDTTIVPLLNEQGKPCQYVAIRADITERKKFEEAMRTVNEELEARVAQRTAQLERALEREKELSVLKSRFISMASHEFRTPLTAIQASSDLLRHYGERMNMQQKVERLDRIQGEVRNMNLLLEDVLFVGKSDAGRVEFKPEPTDLDAACQEMCLEIQATLPNERAIHFTTNRARVAVPADRKLLRHIVTNLLCNAVKYSGSDTLVSLDVNFQPERVLLTVRDHGIGIPSTDLPRLFEPFHRGANVSDIPGTGLGLAIVKRSTEAHGGSITVESEVGRGTCFTVTIPLPLEKMP